MVAGNYFFKNMDKTIFSEASQKLCSLLREVRVEKGVRQQELAELLSEPQSFVSKYESGERRLDVVELYQICVALGIPFSDFIARFEQSLNRKSRP